MNRLYYGDNLDVLRECIASESVDLAYLDPPFKAHDGAKAAAQIQAFEDTWEWNEESARACAHVIESGGPVSDAMRAFRTFLGDSDMMAYLAMMAPRLVELRRVLKPAGNIFLHCDPAASHYLKMLMDGTFGPENFRNEIVWHRTAAKGLMTRALAGNHDVILSYQRSAGSTWNTDQMFTAYDPDDLDEKTLDKYSATDATGRRYQLTSLLNPNPDRPHLTYEFLGITRVWRWTKPRMQAAYEAGLVIQPRPGAVPRYKRYLDEQRGKPFGDVWTDIPPINARARERLGYPTQKPEPLLERLIQAGSNPGDVVLDAFCGCGTTIAAAQKLERQWIGIDVTFLAINLIRQRLRDQYGPDVDATYEVIGQPTTVQDAANLAAEKPHQFQWWATGQVGGRLAEQKKGADRGIDGRIFFHDEGPKGPTKQIILSVKAGHLKPEYVRELRGVIEREQAVIGGLLCLNEPTKAMRREAANAGFYKSPWGSEHARLQILTVAELLEGKRIDYPAERQTQATFKRAPRAVKEHEQPRLREAEDV
jgi:DNA modification methylase